MRIFIYLILTLSINLLSANTMRFTDIDNKEMLQLEQDIAYLFGVQKTEPVINAYMEALQILEQHTGPQDLAAIKQSMLPALEAAYTEIAKQRHIHFDIHLAANFEADLILAQRSQAPFELIEHIMLDLYQTIFNKTNKEIQQAATLRTFLYKYKIQLIASNKLSTDDINIMKMMEILKKIQIH